MAMFEASQNWTKHWRQVFPSARQETEGKWVNELF